MALDDKAKKHEPERYQYAAVAAGFLQGKDVGSAKKCLDKLLVDMGASDEDIKAGMIWNAYSDNTQERIQGIAKGVEIYAGKYEEALGKKTMDEMFERYSAEFDKYLKPEQKEKAKNAFGKLGNKTYEAISEQVAQLQEIIESKTKKYSDKDKENARKELGEKYGNIYNTIQEFENLRMSKLMAPIRESTIKDNVSERFSAKENKGNE